MDKAKVQALAKELYRTHATAVAEALYLEICDDIFKMAFHILGDHQLAEDATSDVTAQIISEINAGVVIDEPVAYARKMTRNTALDCLKKRKWEISDEELFCAPPDVRSSRIEEEIEAKVLWSQLLSQVREDEKNILLMYLVEGYTHKQIAQTLNRPESTVRNIYARSVKKLRAIAKRQEQGDGGEADAQIDQTRDRGGAAKTAQDV